MFLKNLILVLIKLVDYFKFGLDDQLSLTRKQEKKITKREGN